MTHIRHTAHTQPLDSKTAHQSCLELPAIIPFGSWCLSIGLVALLLSGCKQSSEPAPVEPDEVASSQSPAPVVPSVPNRYPPAPELPPEPDTLKIAVISDINGSYGTVGYSPTVKAAIQDIISKDYDFVLSPGDLVAGQRAGLDYDRMWKSFHYEVGDVFFDNNLEFIFAPGNHDASAFEGHFLERQAYARAFANRKPRAELLEGSHFPFYYAVIIRDVLVVALDITRPINDNDPQLAWLEKTLQTQARARLVLGHFPLSPLNFSQFWEVASSPKLLDILQKSPSTLYISGHHHIYYPGHIGELRTIAMPALGSGPRSLMGAPATAGYVQIVIPPQAPPRVTALIAPEFDHMINIQTLPQQVVHAQREDVGMAEYIIEMLDHNAQIPQPPTP